ncbi:MAG: hypothetical protein IKJ95_00010 [Bacteroidaceae bacterium]|nr:hypothetical protein [Bacteroidaceae bacterium]
MKQNIIDTDSQALPLEEMQGGGAQPNGAAQAAENAGLGNYGRLDDGLKRVFGSDFSIDNPLSQDLLLQYVFQNSRQNERLAQVLERDPRMAQLLMDMINGKRNAHSAVARYFGRSLMELDEESPEYEEMLMADGERQEEVMRMANDRREYENNLRASMPVIEQFCDERGYDPSEFMDKVWEQVVFPILTGRYTTEVCTALDHALTYEQDVEDAFAAGDIKGRNTNIQRMKANFGDGLPKGMASVAPPADNKPKGNSLISKALNA